MAEFGELEFETPLEEEVGALELPPGKRAVYTEPADAEIESLYNKYKRVKLIVQPDFQREYVWDSKRASRLIESALLGIPIPIVYISEEPDNKEYVIDGQQRLTSFFSFLDGKFPDGSDFKLTGLQVFSELNGKACGDLSDAQAVRKRFDLWRGALDRVVGTGTKEPRCFTRQLKQAMFDAEATCAICGQRIDHVDDAAVDHIEQYWTGGKTIPDNARLAHRYCNWARPRKDEHPAR